MRVSVLGLGKLGLPMASVFAKVGKSGGLALPIIGIDVDKEKVDRINRGECPIPEPDVGLGGIAATTDYEAAAKTDISFIVVNTPPRADGRLCLDDLEQSCRELARCLKDKSHIVVISSTVPPGTLDSLRGIFSPHVALVSNPHFIALGKVVKDLTRPDFILVGSDSERARREVARIWRKVGHQSAVDLTLLGSVILTTPIMAELIKFALTPYLCMRINYANFLAGLCDMIPGADVDQVLEAIGLDRRINTEVLSAGLPWGGECYPKDVDAFIRLSQDLGFGSPNLLESIRTANWNWTDDLVNLIQEKLNGFKGKRIAFLGVSYKPGYPLLNMSKPLQLANFIASIGGIVRVYDPQPEIQLDNCTTLSECLKDADAVIIAVPYPEFRNLRLRDLPSKDTPVIDIWRVLKGTELAKQGNWMPLGIGR